MLEKSLQNIGIPKEQAYILRLVLEYGPISAVKLSELTSYPRTSVYGYLNKLTKKGLVATTIENDKKIYFSQGVDTIFESINKEIDNLEKNKTLIEDEIKKLKLSNFFQPEISHYYGIDSMQNLFMDMTKSNEKKIYTFYSSIEYPKEFFNFIKRVFIPQRVENKVEIMLISGVDSLSNLDEEHLRISKYIPKVLLDKYTEGKILSSEMSIVDNCVYLFSFDKNSYHSIKIEHKPTADLFKLMHSMLWDTI